MLVKMPTTILKFCAMLEVTTLCRRSIMILMFFYGLCRFVALVNDQMRVNQGRLSLYPEGINALP